MCNLYIAEDQNLCISCTDKAKNYAKKQGGMLCAQMKSFIAKQVISILVNFRYLRFKLLKYIKKIRKSVILLVITSKIYLYI